MKQLLSFLMLAMLFANSATADDKSNISIKLYSSIESSKIIDHGLTVHGDPVVKGMLSVNYNGWGLHLFHSTGLGECFENESSGAQEITPSISYANMLGKWSTLAKASYFSIGEFMETPGDVFQFKVRGQFVDWVVKPYLETNYQYLLGDSGGIGLTHLGAEWPINLSEKWTLTFAGDATYDSASFRDNGWIARGNVNLWRKINSSTQVGIWMKGVAPLTEFESDREGGAAGIGFQRKW